MQIMRKKQASFDYNIFDVDRLGFIALNRLDNFHLMKIFWRESVQISSHFLCQVASQKDLEIDYLQLLIMSNIFVCSIKIWAYSCLIFSLIEHLNNERNVWRLIFFDLMYISRMQKMVKV